MNDNTFHQRVVDAFLENNEDMALYGKSIRDMDTDELVDLIKWFSDDYKRLREQVRNTERRLV